VQNLKRGAIVNIVGINIRNIRMNRGLTQAEFAKKIGISDKAISTYENGTRNPKMDVVIKIANVFHLTTGEILESNPTDVETKLLSSFRSLSTANKNIVINLINSLLDAQTKQKGTP